MTAQGDHFATLGLPRSFELSSQQIEDNYLARSRELHPDYHRMGADSEQRASMELTASLNEAYSTLRDPFQRAEHLLTLEGGPSAAEMKNLAPEFLEETLELRMEIEMLRNTQDADGIEAMEQQLLKRKRDLLDQIGAHFQQLDESREPTLHRIRELLNATRFVQGLLRDLYSD